MNSKQLQYFMVTARMGSIAAAARELDIAQPAISQQLSGLERELDVELFSRSFKGVELTNAGEIFLKHAHDLIDVINAAKIELQDFSSNLSGTVKVGMLPSIGNAISMQLISEIQANHSELKLEISTGPSYSVKGWLESNKIDIAITYEQDVDRNFMNCSPLIEESMFLVVTTTAANTPEQLLDRHTIQFWELSQFELLTPSSNDALGKLIEHFSKKTGIALKRDSTYSGQLMTGLRQVIQGDGLMILPYSAFYHLEEAGVVRSLRIVEPEMKRIVYTATHKSRPLSAPVIRVMNTIKNVAQDAQTQGHWQGQIA
jgi:LysR family nitrogen assimilation transcriptional regulator